MPHHLRCTGDGQYSFNFGKKIFEADWLGLVAIESFGEHRLAVMGHGGCGDGDDGYVRGFRLCPKLFQRRDAVDAGQLDIHEDESRALL